MTKSLDSYNSSDSDAFANLIHRKAEGYWKPIYPSEVGRSLKHVEADFNYKLLSGSIANYRIYPSGQTPSTHSDVEDFSLDQNKVLTLRKDGNDFYWTMTTGGSGGGGQWTRIGNDIYYSDGNVGIGTSTPSEALEVIGKIQVSDEFIGDLRGAIRFSAKAGEALVKGEAVYISGISGNKPEVMRANAGDSNKMPAFGLVFDSANQNSNVEIVTFGTLAGIDTAQVGWSLGDTLYVGTTDGILENNPPTGENNLIQNIGKIQRLHVNGSIKVGGAGRTNATPNLNSGNIFIGDVNNQATAQSITGDITIDNAASVTLKKENLLLSLGSYSEDTISNPFKFNTIQERYIENVAFFRDDTFNDMTNVNIRLSFFYKSGSKLNWQLLLNNSPTDIIIADGNGLSSPQGQAPSNDYSDFGTWYTVEVPSINLSTQGLTSNKYLYLTASTNYQEVNYQITNIHVELYTE